THAAAAKNVGKDITEDVAKTTGPGTRTAGTGTTEPGMTELIVRGTLLVVGEHFIGFGGLLEARFRCFITGIAVGMIFHRQASIGLLYFVLGSALRYAQYLVIIFIRHTESNENAGATFPPLRLTRPAGYAPAGP